MNAGAFHPGPNASLRKIEETRIIALCANYARLAGIPLSNRGERTLMRDRIRVQREALHRILTEQVVHK